MEGRENNPSAIIHLQNIQGTEMAEVSISAAANSISSSQIHIASAQPRFASSHLLENNQEAREKYLSIGVPLSKASLRGDWETAKSIIHKDRSILTASITKGGQTVLHLVAGTKCLHFVEQVVEMMNEQDLALRDQNGNTALCFAATTGSLQVTEIMLRKNPCLATIRGGEDMTPLYMAALFGNSEVAWCLYHKTKQTFQEKDRIGIFFTCIDTALYDLALNLLEDEKSLATARGNDEETALHLLAQTPSAFAKQNSNGWSKLIGSYLKFGSNKRNLKQTKALELVRCVWKHVLHLGDDVAMSLIQSPSNLLFDATELGNFEFLSELINAYPDLIWETDSQNRTIIHVAVLHRHANIFNLVHDIPSIKGILATYEDANGNNILHLAAKLPHSNRLNTISGAAFQMQHELLWFEEVKKIVQPLFIKKKNKEGKVPQELFSEVHKPLLNEGEKWMKSTARSCMIVSTLIATGVFAAAFSLPGGNNNNGTPNNLQNTSFLIFVLADGFALFFSIVATLMFLSILISRYAEYDFFKSLPLKLMIGLTSLFFSMITMMVAFSSTVVMAYHNWLKWVPFLISIFAFVPIALFAILQFPLFLDTFSSTYFSRTLFQPNGQMLY